MKTDLWFLLKNITSKEDIVVKMVADIVLMDISKSIKNKKTQDFQYGLLGFNIF